MTEGLNFSNWSLESYFKEFDGPEYRAMRDGLIEKYDDFFKRAVELETIEESNLDQWAGLFLEQEEMVLDHSHLASYIGCLNSDDANNETYKVEQGKMSQISSLAQKAQAPVMAALGSVSDGIFEKLVSDERLVESRYYFERQREEAMRRMDREKEILAADLSVDGISSWGRLYNDLTGRLEFVMPQADGTLVKVPMSQRRGFLQDVDPEVRKAAFVNSNKVWEEHAPTLAACLNAISGWRLTLNKHRGVENFLDVAMFQSGVEEATIDKMFEVIAKNRSVAQRYLKQKAKLMGLEKLGFQDLSAPLPLKSNQTFDWETAKQKTLDAFSVSYPALSEYTQMAIDKNWIESEKRAGKRSGAFCTSSYKSRESRVFMTFGGTLGDILTLAHELGHAFHNWVMRDLRPTKRKYPMTLAETASTFAEDLLCRSIINDVNSDDATKLMLLNTQLDHAVTFMLDIHVRFLFERKLYQERSQGELSVSRLKEIMLETQLECFGDTLDTEQMDPFFWASKLHFYITGVSFYNFPYTFGFFFSNGISSRFQQEGESFLSKYESLLRLTGSATAEEVARQSLDVELDEAGFWEQAIQRIDDDIKKFEALAPQVLAVG